VTGEPVSTARALVEERFPHARAAFLSGSVLGPARTPTSDLDVTVVVADGEPAYRETLRHAGWVVELFVQTPAVHEWFVARETARGHLGTLHMVGFGTVLVDADGTATALQATARERVAAGPPPPTPQRIEDLWYFLSDILDDLVGAGDPDEIAVIAGRVFEQAATTALTLAGCWLGTGKWLGRRLRDADPDLHAELIGGLREAVAGDKARLVAVAASVLDRAGGPLVDGYRRDAPAEACE